MVCEQSAPRVVTEQLIRSFDQMAPVRFEYLNLNRSAQGARNLLDALTDTTSKFAYQ
jgi:hypothetical protein